jgi:ferredoxin-NADP reductase
MMDARDGTVLSARSMVGRALRWMSYPREPEDFLAPFWPVAEPRELRAKVIDVRPEASGCATLVLSVGRRWRGHRAGQWVALSVELDGARRTRCFSISSAPSDGARTIELTIKARPDGAVTPTLISRAMIDKVVTLSPAQGDFVLPSPTPRRLLFVSGGSGITPIMSMLRTLDRDRALGGSTQVTVVHFARALDEVLFLDDLRALPGVSLHIETERALGRAPSLSEESLAALLPEFESYECFTCGPEPLVAAVERAFAARGQSARVHVERFTRASTVATEDTAGSVTFARSGVTARADRPLLLVAEQSGLNPPSGCGIGICGTCLCKKLSGTTRDLRTGALSSEGDTDIALCSTVAVGDVSIDL